MQIASQQSLTSRRSHTSENILKESNERHLRKLFSLLLSTTPPPPPPSSTSFSTSTVNKNLNNGENIVENNNLLIDLESEKTAFPTNETAESSSSDRNQNKNSMSAIEEMERSASSSTLFLVSKKLPIIVILIRKTIE